MKRILQYIILSTVIFICGCSDFDDSNLVGKIDEFKTRIEALKKKASDLNEQINDLSYLTNGNVITSINQDTDGKYVVTYKDNKDESHTLIVATRSDIIEVPILGVKLGDDGIYYWTQHIDNETQWLLDENGDKLPVSGYTPTISVDDKGFWLVNGKQVLDESGNPVPATTEDSSLFKSAQIDSDGNFSLTLGDGSKITMPVFNSLNLKLDVTPVIVVSDISRTYTVNYQLSGDASEKAIADIAKAEGLIATIDKTEKKISVSFPPYFKNATLIVMAYDLNDNVVIRPVIFKVASNDILQIANADELKAFANEVNQGGEMAFAKVELISNIDMSGVSWTPIGNGTYTTANVISGASFKGEFNGQGFAVTNLEINIPANAESGSAWGLFGITEGAVIKNLNIGVQTNTKNAGKGFVKSESVKLLTAGAIVGYAFETTIEDCVNYASFDISGGANGVRQTFGGIAGSLCNKENDSYIKNCINYGPFKSINTINANNGASGFSIGGIIGFADAAGITNNNEILDCVNYGEFNVQATRTAGIVATMNKYTRTERCINNADIINSDVTASNSRTAGIVSAMGSETYLSDCINKGNIIYSVVGNTTKGYVAGIAGQTNNDGSIIDGCENYGSVLSDMYNASSNKYIAIICANTNKKLVTIKNCKIAGKIGSYENGETGAMEISAANFTDHIYFTLDGGSNPILENNGFIDDVKKGISTVSDLLAFRDAVNSGTSTEQWQNTNGEVVLLNDIDMSEVSEWIPIGSGTFTFASNSVVISDNRFTGVFDGQNYALKNFNIKYTGSLAGATFGLFGVLENATVKNLLIGSKSGDASSLTVSSSGSNSIDAGIIAGLCYESTIENCTNYGTLIYNGSTSVRATLGMVGFMFNNEIESKLSYLKNYGNINASATGNTNNGATSVQVAGICGFTTNSASSTKRNEISYCDNYGDITSNAGRSSGIVAAVNKYAYLNSCTNHGNQINSFPTVGGGRLGNITCITGTGTIVVDCINNGDLISTTSARCGGVVSLVNSSDNTFSGCANYGSVITDSEYRGIFFGYSNNTSSWSNCIVGGKLGAYNNGTFQEDYYPEASQSSYLGKVGTTSPTLNNITYIIGSTEGGSGSGPEATLRILFIGNSFTKDAVEHLPAMISAAGINTVKITHAYYGGRTIPEYNNGYVSTSDYYCYDFYTGSSSWVTTKNRNLQEIVKMENWDIVSIQEHTGRVDAWDWTLNEKNAIDGIISKIKSNQGSNNPKFVYIMSQAYYNMNKLANNQSGRFSSQNEMFETIVTQAKKVLDETAIEQIIPTGTVLQNLRTSSINVNNGMDLTRDGYHMDYGISRYAASCAVFEMLISPYFDNIKLDDNSFRYSNSSTSETGYSTPITDNNTPIALSAARSAILYPFIVTSMVDK